MAVTLRNNLESAQIVRRLGEADRRLGSAMTRLSSGLRITRASDDAAGLSVAAALHLQERVAGQAVRNVNDGVSLVAVAEGAVTALVDIVTRQKELAEQAANGAYSSRQRTALNTEAAALTSEYNRIISSTTFNGVSVFGGQDLFVQSGFGGVETTRVGSGTALQHTTGAVTTQTVGLGTFTSQSTKSIYNDEQSVMAADVNHDGKQDVIAIDRPLFDAEHLRVYLGNGSGGFTQSDAKTNGYNTYRAGEPLALGDFDGDGNIDIAEGHGGGGGHTDGIVVYYGNGDGTFSSGTDFASGSGGAAEGLESGDFNGDGKTDLVKVDYTTTQIQILLAQAGRTFAAPVGYATDLGPYEASVGDIDGDGKLDIAVSSQWVGPNFFYGNGDGTFSAKQTIAGLSGSAEVELRDLDKDGKAEVVALGGGTLKVFRHSGPRTFLAPLSYSTTASPSNGQSIGFGDVNNDGKVDVLLNGGNSITRLYGSGDGTLQAEATAFTSTTSLYNFALFDGNGDGVLDLAAPLHGTNSWAYATGDSHAVTTDTTVTTSFASAIDLTTVAGARAALDDRTQLLATLGASLGLLGAQQSRLEAVLSRVGASRLEYGTAEHRITDADVAADAATLVAESIRRHVAGTVLAQSSVQNRLALRLLGG